MSIDPSALKGPPRRWFMAPFLAGLALILLGVLGWIYPRLLLFLICFPLVAAGLALVLFALDLWRGVPRQWQDRVRTVHLRMWHRDDQEL